MKTSLQHCVNVLSEIERNLALISWMDIEGDITEDVSKRIEEQRKMVFEVLEVLNVLSNA